MVENNFMKDKRLSLILKEHKKLSKGVGYVIELLDVDIKFKLTWESDDTGQVELVRVKFKKTGSRNFVDFILGNRPIKHLRHLEDDVCQLTAEGIYDCQLYKQFNDRIRLFIKNVAEYEKDNDLEKDRIWEDYLWPNC